MYLYVLWLPILFCCHHYGIWCSDCPRSYRAWGSEGASSCLLCPSVPILLGLEHFFIIRCSRLGLYFSPPALGLDVSPRSPGFESRGACCQSLAEPLCQSLPWVCVLATAVGLSGLWAREGLGLRVTAMGGTVLGWSGSQAALGYHVPGDRWSPACPLLQSWGAGRVYEKITVIPKSKETNKWRQWSEATFLGEKHLRNLTCVLGTICPDLYQSAHVGCSTLWTDVSTFWILPLYL